jgi:hypothetical protein
VGAWVELYNTTTTTRPTRTTDSVVQAPGQPQDAFPIPLLSGAGTATNPFQAPYQIVLAGALYSNTSTASNGNPLGMYNYLKVATSVSDFQNTTPPTNIYVKTPASGTPTAVSYGAQPAATLLTPTSTGTQTNTLNPPYIDITPSATAVAAGATNTPYFLLAPSFPTGAFPGPTNTALFADFLTKTVPGSNVPGGNNPIATSTILYPNTPFIQTPNLQYTPTGTGGIFTQGTGTPPPDERTTGLTVLLRRLANPHMPLQADSTAADYNPYVTVDYMDQVPILGLNLAQTPYSSRGKQEPFASATAPASGGQPANSPVRFAASFSMTQEQIVPDSNPSWQHTFGAPNLSSATISQYDWLVHLDRQVVSPVELLHVSSYPPFQLTQRFVDITSGTPVTSGHLAPWLDQTRRLYRLFEFMDTNNRGAGVAESGRVSGKLNINTLWDVELFRALCDQNTSTWIGSGGPGGSTYSASDVDTIFTNMLTNSGNGRTPNKPPNVTVTGPTPPNSPALPSDFDATAFAAAGFTLPSGYPTTLDRPFLSLATGQTTGATGTQFPNNRGIDDTLFRSFSAGIMLQDPGDAASTATTHPYLKYQLLNKIFNNVTNRSNCFAVWVTVGFFEVTDATTTPPKLGAEIGRLEGRNVRHRMFAVVDRTNLAAFQTNSINTAPITLTTQDASGPTGVDANGGQAFFRATDMTTIVGTTDSRPGNTNTITIAAGMPFVFEPGTDNEETVITYLDSTGKVVGEFHKPHGTAANPSVPIIIRGNPGPWKRYDPRNDPSVVLHWNVIN